MFPPVPLPKSGIDTQKLGDTIVATMFGTVPQVSPEEINDGTSDAVRFWSPSQIGAYLTGHGVTPDQLAALAAEVDSLPDADDINVELLNLSSYVDSLFTAARASGEMGWVHGASSYALSGLNSIDLPADVANNEILIKFQGLSPSASADLRLGFLKDDNTVATANEHYGYYNGAANSAINPLTYMPVALGLVGTDFVSGEILLRKHQGPSAGTWNYMAIVDMFQAATRNYRVLCTSPNLGTGCKGVRLTLTAGTWDSGAAYVSWKK